MEPELSPQDFPKLAGEKVVQLTKERTNCLQQVRVNTTCLETLEKEEINPLICGIGGNFIKVRSEYELSIEG